MTSRSANLDNLVAIGKLKLEAPDRREFEGLLEGARARLVDAGNAELSIESRFDLAYNASHALALAALRLHGYRSENRYLVFQLLEQTLGLPAPRWRVLAKCHELRNQMEYGGKWGVDAGLLRDLLAVAAELLGMIEAPDPPD